MARYLSGAASGAADGSGEGVGSSAAPGGSPEDPGGGAGSAHRAWDAKETTNSTHNAAAAKKGNHAPSLA